MLHGVSGKSGDKGGKYGLKIIYVKNSKHTWGPGGTPSVFLIFYVFLKEHFISLIT